jgi:parvulin-like peptidyl-prolyl isomerase
MKVIVLGFVLVCLGAVSAYAQEQSTPSAPSLGDIARQLKAQKANAPKPVKVFTNDNLPTSNAGITESSEPEKSPADTTSAAPGGHDEKYYRKQMATLQDQLDTDKRELDVLQQKLGQNNMQYYPNPQDSLTQQYTRSDINKLTAEIDAKKKQVDSDQKAIDDLREQLRQEGGDPSWLR